MPSLHFWKVVANFCLFSSIHSCVFTWWFVDFCFCLWVLLFSSRLRFLFPHFFSCPTAGEERYSGLCNPASHQPGREIHVGSAQACEGLGRVVAFNMESSNCWFTNFRLEEMFVSMWIIYMHVCRHTQICMYVYTYLYKYIYRENWKDTWAGLKDQVQIISPQLDL